MSNEHDRELLKLAAKAAGFAIDRVAEDDGLVVGNGERSRANWNPLTDDGDALRLAVTLEFNVYHMASWVYVEEIQYAGDRVSCERHGEDKFAATRRAIVRAAAKIGEQGS